MNTKLILRASGLLGVLFLLTASMRDVPQPAPRTLMYVPEAAGCQLTYPAGTHPAPDFLPKGTLLTGPCLVAR